MKTIARSTLVRNALVSQLIQKRTTRNPSRLLFFPQVIAPLWNHPIRPVSPKKKKEKRKRKKKRKNWYVGNSAEACQGCRPPCCRSSRLRTGFRENLSFLSNIFSFLVSILRLLALLQNGFKDTVFIFIRSVWFIYFFFLFDYWLFFAMCLKIPL